MNDPGTKKPVAGTTGHDIELEHLIQMLGDIERNLAFYPDAGARIAEHLEKYWAPSMRQRILDFALRDGEGLTALSRSALKTLTA